MLNKRSCLDRAKALLAKGDADSLRYAALELRLCMEAITYEKLSASASHIPPEVLEKWQPPQAVKALLEYEPKADKGFVLFAGVEKEYGKPSTDMRFVGEHKTLELGWLRKHYNKVGSYLHVATKSHNPNQSDMAAYLAEVAVDLTEATTGTITGGWLSVVHHVECVVCKQRIVVGEHRLKTSGHFTCLNPSCGAEYYGKLDADGRSVINLKVTEFDCGQCETKIPVENRKLDIGKTFQCPACKTVHTIEQRQWGYSFEKKS